VNEQQVHRFVQRYLETTNCQIIEKSPHHFLVKLSPRADRDLTNRPFYWSFVDRTGAEPETMSMLLVTDKRKYDEAAAANPPAGPYAPRIPPQAMPPGIGGNGRASGPGAAGPAGLRGGASGTAGGSGGIAAAGAAGHRGGASGAAGGSGGIGAAADAALSRSLGFVHGTLNAAARVPRDDLHFGSRKLEQLFESARKGGSYVCLFQEQDPGAMPSPNTTAYTAWLGVNMKVEFTCDMKREEIHSFGVSLATGECVERFHERLLGLPMTPKLPPNVQIASSALPLGKAAAAVEDALERKLREYDYGWAEAAAKRLSEELATIAHYYVPLVESADDMNKPAILEQFERRQAEIRWQYEPRVSASVINCGIFYLAGIG
jgi:hypothetical protein